MSLPGGIKSFLFTKLIKMQEAWRVLLSGASLSGDNSPFSVGYEVRMGEGKREGVVGNAGFCLLFLRLR